MSSIQSGTLSAIFGLLVSISLVLSALTVKAEPLIIDADVNDPYTASDIATKLHLHETPDKNSPAVKPHLSNAGSYRFDKEEVIVRKPGIVEALSSLEVTGEDGSGARGTFHLKKGDRFESSSADTGVNINMTDGSDCLARIQGTIIYPDECLWLSGWGAKRQAGKVRYVTPAGEDEEWYRLVDAHGRILGWQLRDWPLGAD